MPPPTLLPTPPFQPTELLHFPAAPVPPLPNLPTSQLVSRQPNVPYDPLCVASEATNSRPSEVTSEFDDGSDIDLESVISSPPGTPPSTPPPRSPRSPPRSLLVPGHPVVAPVPCLPIPLVSEPRVSPSCQPSDYSRLAPPCDIDSGVHAHEPVVAAGPASTLPDTHIDEKVQSDISVGPAPTLATCSAVAGVRRGLNLSKKHLTTLRAVVQAASDDGLFEEIDDENTKRDVVDVFASLGPEG